MQHITPEGVGPRAVNAAPLLTDDEKRRRAEIEKRRRAEVRAANQRRQALMTVGDLAAQRNCSVATVWRHVKAGLLPKPVKIGGLTRWVPEEVDATTEAAMAARSPQIAA